jgi:hypothetical protein
MSSDVNDTAGEFAGQAQESAQQAVGQAREKMRQQLAQRTSQAAQQINGQAADLRSVSDSLREQGKDGPAEAAGRLAGYAEQVGGYLREKDPDALLNDAEEFGRRRPWATAAGGLALGFAASRFLKASSTQRYQSRTGQTPTPAQSPTPTPAPALGRPDRPPLGQARPAPADLPTGRPGSAPTAAPDTAGVI